VSPRPGKPVHAPARERPEDRLPHRRLRPVKLPQRIASAIVEDIVAGDLAAGDALPTEADLAERFGVSRVSIREALRVLEAFGVVRIKPGKNGGNEVGAIDAEALARVLALFFRMARATYRDLMDARLVIEPFMARRAAERGDRAQLDELRDLLEREAASTAGTPEGDQLALAFHWLVCGGSGNPVMDALGQALHTLYGDHLAANLLYDPGGWTTARNIHQEIGKAILAGDGRRAQELMASHMQDFLALQEERTPWLLDERVAWQP
jgi:GntR family transcriptional regulator, transcriptional repressor for pyruvate dehydrogenase complex